MAAKKKKKPVSKKRKSELAKLIKKFPKTKKALKKTAILGAAPAFYGYQGAKGKDVDLGSLLGTLDLTDPMLRNLWGNLIKKEAGEAKEEYFGKDSNWKDKVQLAADIGGTIWDFSPFGFLTDSDVGYGSKKLGAGTLDNYSPQQLKELRRKAMLGSEVKRKKGGKIIKSKTKKNKKSGRPKGVGCATRGYGKAMKRGK
tara:strand:+ start:54 stop:650 length:597 start_codon:yes stop_codon:yes gene_type:complete